MKKKKIIKYALLALLVLGGAAALYIWKEYNRTHKDTASLKPDYTVEATDFIREYQANEQASNKKYWDKVVKVRGRVKQLSRDERGFCTILLGDTASMSSVRCSIDSAHTQEARSIQENAVIAVKGICSGFTNDELLGADIILVRAVVEQQKQELN